MTSFALEAELLNCAEHLFPTSKKEERDDGPAAKDDGNEKLLLPPTLDVVVD